jgi:quaternary ammonium compound-resistance protein SugE
MPWVYLVVAGVLEIVWAVAMKQSDGFTRLIPSAITLAGMIASVGLLALAMRNLPLGTAYMVWTGIGAVGTFAFGSFFLGEQISAAKVVAATMIIAGLLTMKLAEG